MLESLAGVVLVDAGTFTPRAGALNSVTADGFWPLLADASFPFGAAGSSPRRLVGIAPKATHVARANNQDRET